MPPSQRKAYTMKEMRGIVDFVSQNKAYSEVRGRKMWVDFANTTLTDRTWQSLKETFIKRILPEIHNPYYRLSQDEIRSFRAGYDVTTRSLNKLEFHSSKPSTSAQKHLEQPSTSGCNGDKASGEDSCNVSPRRDSNDSVDTVIIQPKGYKTPQDLLNDLESEGDNDTETSATVAKSLRDCFEYEPLTPMMQGILNDFQSDESDSGKAVTTKHDSQNAQNTDNSQSELNKVVSKEAGDEHQINKCNPHPDEKNANVDSFEETCNIIKKSARLKNLKQTSGDNIDSSNQNEINENSIMQNKDNSDKINVMRTIGCEVVVEDSQKIQINKRRSGANSTQSSKDVLVQESSNATPDSVLPDNQEALSIKKSDQNTNDQLPTSGTPGENKGTKKNRTPRKRIRPVSSSGSEKFEQLKKPSPLKLKRTNGKWTASSVLEKLEQSKKTSPLKLKKKNGKKTESCVNYPKKKLANDEDDAVTTDKKTPNDNKPSSEPLNELNGEVTKENVEKEQETVVNDPICSQTSNPCLQSISLFAEQFITCNSDSEDNFQPKNKSPQKTNGSVMVRTTSHSKGIVLLHSNSDESSDTLVLENRKEETRRRKIKVLNNLFGGTSGNHKEKKSCYKGISRNRDSDSSDSSWTSESDNAFVSPPTRSKRRSAKRYHKPTAAKIHSLDQDGGMFIVNGKKLYPLVKTDRAMNFVTYKKCTSLTSSESEDNEPYWKMKYLEQRKKKIKLKKLLERPEIEEAIETIDLEHDQSSILQSKSLQIKESLQPPQSIAAPAEQVISLDDDGPNNNKQSSLINKKETSEKSIKIKFIANDEIHVEQEGSWKSQDGKIPITIQLYRGENQAPKGAIHINIPEKSEPLVDEVRPATVEDKVAKHVDDIEEAIQREIMERDKEEEAEENKNNVTTRKRGRPNQASSLVSLAKRRKSRELSQRSDSDVVFRSRLRPLHAPTGARRKSSSSSVKKSHSGSPPSKKSHSGSPPAKKSPSVSLPATKSLTGQAKKIKSNSKSVDIPEDDSLVLYKFPSPERNVTPVKSPKTKRSSTKSPRRNKSDLKIKFPTVKPPETFSCLSIESTQGYQDSENSSFSLIKIQRKKKKFTHTIGPQHRGRQFKRKSSQRFNGDASNESSNSSFNILARKVANSSTINSDVYRSQSYQLLMAQDRQLIVRLQRIEETNPCPNEMNSVCGNNYLHLSPASQNMNVKSDISRSSNSHTNTEIANSSSVSLPLSPELSIVENISLSKDLVNTVSFPILNEEQTTTVDMEVSDNYLMSQIDTSVPLMKQASRLRMSYRPNSNETDQSTIILLDSNSEIEETTNIVKGTTVTDSLLSKIDTVSLSDAAGLSSSLDSRLKELLLESTKKVRVGNKENNADTASDVGKKTKALKRCSTPRKRKVTKKSQTPIIESVEEECTELCASIPSRKSCPDIIYTFSSNDITAKETHLPPDLTKLTASKTERTSKPKKKVKNVIKVKILRPRDKSKSRRKSKKNASMLIDSGINDTTSSAIMANNSTNLIHNHSENCLTGHECLYDSVEYVDRSKSAISLDTSSMEDTCVDEMDNQDSVVRAALYCTDAQDGSRMSRDRTNRRGSFREAPMSAAQSSSSLTHNSLLTEDLSDERTRPRSGNWYLFSDEETTNAELIAESAMNRNYAGLKQLFPVTCQVPDLSTITESGDSNSRKGTPRNKAGKAT